MIPLTKLQKEIMTEFYNCAPQKVVFNKFERDAFWKIAKAKGQLNVDDIRTKCPALAHQIAKSYESKRNIQSAVFSECVYSQALAYMLDLNIFTNCLENNTFIPDNIHDLLNSHNITPRYAYSNEDKSRILIQAGGCNAIDSVLISVADLKIYHIEFKEPGAKTCEPDLPRYGEDGNLLVTDKFLKKYPQFIQMLNEQKDLNFFEKMGNNEHCFSLESIDMAVNENYVQKHAEVVCTEDVDGYLVMLPATQLSTWANIEGEIRPAGRNHSKVYTPIALKNYIEEKGGQIVDSTVTIDRSKLGLRKERGGDGRVSGYKINSLFFVYIYNCSEIGDKIIFSINSIRQLKPTIAGKMGFGNLKYTNVKDYYFNN